MINKMLKEADGEGSGEESGSGSDGSDSDAEGIKMKFDEQSKQKQKGDSKKTQKGIMGLKFMERAQEKEKEALKS